jgi:hypothetical protein
MNLELGSQRFANVEIPILWGDRAVLSDKKGRLSIVNLAASNAVIEVLADKPAPGIAYELSGSGYKIFDSKQIAVYYYEPSSKTITPISIKLPEIQIGEKATRIGSNHFSSNMVSGFGVGILVTETGIALGAPLPPGLARLKI